MRYVGALLVLMAACGGTEAPEPAPAAQSARAGSYIRSETSAFPATGPSATADLAVACGQGETLLAGGCEVGTGGTITEDASDGVGWVCAARSNVDGVSMRVWVECK